MGSSSRQETKVPAYIEEAGKLALQRAQEIQGMGYIPYTGPEIAAISDTERALNRNVGAMASAFGLEGPAPLSMGDAQLTSAGGVSGYSSYPAYMAAMERLKEQRPDQYAYLSGMTRFDPITGMENPEYMARMQTAQPAQPAPVQPMRNDDGPSFAPMPTGIKSNYSTASVSGPMATSLRPQIRPESGTSSSGGLFSPLKEFSNQIYTAFGGRG